MTGDSRRCQAMSKQTGKRCRQPAVPGKRACRFHGGLSTGPKTPEGKARSSQNALKHGAYAARILSDDEQVLFRDVLARIHEDFSLNDSSDQVAAQSLALAYVQFLRAVEADNAHAAETLSRKCRTHIEKIRARQEARQGRSISSSRVGSPAEWAASLLARTRRHEKVKRRR